MSDELTKAVERLRKRVKHSDNSADLDCVLAALREAQGMLNVANDKLVHCGEVWDRQDAKIREQTEEIERLAEFLADALAVLEAPAVSSDDAKRELARKMREALKGGSDADTV